MSGSRSQSVCRSGQLCLAKIPSGGRNYAFDEFNRLSTANAVDANNNVITGLAWDYDRYGNRWNQRHTVGSATTTALSFGANSNVPTTTISTDIAGNVRNDGIHNYTYDAENRIATVDGGIGYIYDAEGRRAAKTDGTVYTIDTGGNVLVEVQGTAWKRSEVYVGSKHLATVTPAGTNNVTVTFVHGDWLGTERARTNLVGELCETITSQPFGDNVQKMTPQGATPCDLTPDFFTSKPRDTESNLDDFGARYFSSQWGRWMSADWTAAPSSVPYATLTNPQSLNLYAYVGNDPVDGQDADGHFRVVPPNMNNAFYGPACEDYSDAGGDCSGGSGTDGPSGDAATPGSDQTTDPSADQKPKYDASKYGPEDPTNPGKPLYQNEVVKKASDAAFIKTENGRARSGLAEAGFAIEYKDGKISIDHKVDSVNSDKKANELNIQTDKNTIAILHIHGNNGTATPSLPDGKSPGDVASPVPNFVRSQYALYVTVPGTTNFIKLVPAPTN